MITEAARKRAADLIVPVKAEALPARFRALGAGAAIRPLNASLEFGYKGGQWLRLRERV